MTIQGEANKMSDDKLGKYIEATLAYLDAVDAANQTFRNALGRPQPEKPQKHPAPEFARALPENLAALITFEDKGTYWSIKPKEYIHQHEKWVAINVFLAGLGGAWVSVGKESRWEIGKKA